MRSVYWTLLVVLGIFLLGCTQPSSNDSVTETVAGSMESTPILITVEFTTEGIFPSSVEIKKGTTVTWVNKDAQLHWPASAMHPTHEAYPGSSITKCGTPEQSVIFDACKGLAENESYSFTFNEVGEWNYHDHLNVRQPYFGTVKVVE